MPALTEKATTSVSTGTNQLACTVSFVKSASEKSKLIASFRTIP